MPSLYLLRHAKAAAALPGMRDIDRPLDQRGLSDAAAMGHEMKSRGYLPSRILCSPSTRTRQTLEQVLSACPLSAETVFCDDIYSAGAADYLRLVHAHGDTGSLLVIGHNPSTEELAAALTGKGDRAARQELMDGFPTSGLACLEFAEELSLIQPGTGTLSNFISPKHL